MASKDLAMKFDEMVKLVEDERAKMKAEVEAYNAEKAKMQAVKVSDDDVIHLNVGGQKFTTKRSTLCQVEGSLLASMFSGRWEDGLARDKDGCLFLDFNPQYFGLILNYLRAKQIATPEDPAEIPETQEGNFRGLVRYLGLNDDFFPSEKFNIHGTQINLQEGGTVASHDTSSGHRYVLGDKVYQRGIVHFKLKLESFYGNNWLFVGIVQQEGDVVPQDNNSYSWPGCYGWALGNSGQVYKDGKCSHDNNFKNITKQGNIVEIVLNFDAAKLSLHLHTGHQFNIDIPRAKTCRLHVNLHGANDRIRILKA